jgi:hypothetical protein
VVGDSVEFNRPHPEEAFFLHQQAHAWLRANLEVYGKMAASNEPKNRRLATQKLGHWKIDRDLRAARDPAYLALLPDDLRTDWQRLWEEVDKVLSQAGPK